MLKNNHKGVTLVEAFLASLIFVVSVSAILVSIVALRKPAVTNTQEKEAVLVGQQILEEFRSNVDKNDTSGALSGGNHGPFPRPFNNTTYTINYTVRCLDAADQVVDPCDPDRPLTREVQLTITWPNTM